MSKLNQKQLISNYRWNTTQADVSDLLARINIIENKIINIYNILDGIDIDITDIKIRLEKCETDISQIKININMLNTRVSAMEFRISTLENEINIINNKIGEIENEIADLQSKIEWYEKNVKRFFVNQYSITKNIDAQYDNHYEFELPIKFISHMSLHSILISRQIELAEISNKELPSNFADMKISFKENENFYVVMVVDVVGSGIVQDYRYIDLVISQFPPEGWNDN